VKKILKQGQQGYCPGQWGFLSNLGDGIISKGPTGQLDDLPHVFLSLGSGRYQTASLIIKLLQLISLGVVSRLGGNPVSSMVAAQALMRD